MILPASEILAFIYAITITCVIVIDIIMMSVLVVLFVYCYYYYYYFADFRDPRVHLLDHGSPLRQTDAGRRRTKKGGCGELCSVMYEIMLLL